MEPKKPQLSEEELDRVRQLFEVLFQIKRRTRTNSKKENSGLPGVNVK